jgi:hypothetical protein
MREQPHQSEALIREIARYLAAVDLFRAERCEPTWLPKLLANGIAPEQSALSVARRRNTPLAH